MKSLDFPIATGMSLSACMSHLVPVFLYTCRQFLHFLLPLSRQPQSHGNQKSPHKGCFRALQGQVPCAFSCICSIAEYEHTQACRNEDVRSFLWDWEKLYWVKERKRPRVWSSWESCSMIFCDYAACQGQHSLGGRPASAETQGGKFSCCCCGEAVTDRASVR